jgi:lipopolysaccharide biosynthesis glycosyltransferase
MVDTVRVFIGYDRVESIAYHVLCHSIISRSSLPVQIIPVNQKNLKQHYWRPRGEFDSNEFSISRWLVPHLCDFEGHAIFMDCDMLVLGDIAELWNQRDDHAVKVVKHNHVPKEDIKFLGAKQTRYDRKNWSSVMLFNNEKCRPLSKHIVNTMSPGLWFHQFNWLADEDIGEIRGRWNLLVGFDEPDPDVKLIHYTSGGPWHGFKDIDYVDEWNAELEDMIRGDNPVVDWMDDEKTDATA